jgi:hypothetical protein
VNPAVFVTVEAHVRAFVRSALLRSLLIAALLALPALVAAPGASAAVNRTPLANWEAMHVDGSSVTVIGWAMDPDSPTTPVPVHVYIDGVGTARVADGSRPDVGAAFPGAGDNHGAGFIFRPPPGRHTVCVYAIDIQVPWQNTSLGCRIADVPLNIPYGNWDAVTAAGRVLTVTGWAIDPDDYWNPVEMHVYVDGRGRSLQANSYRPDVGAAFGRGDSHGFVDYQVVEAGIHNVCVYAIDPQSPWHNRSFGCRTVEVGLRAPVGNWERMEVSGSNLTVSGWAFDPDRPDQNIAVHAYVDGVGAQVEAWDFRADVSAVYPQAGANHGFTWSTPLSPGSHQVCLYAIDLDTSWRHGALGCRTATV